MLIWLLLYSSRAALSWVLALGFCVGLTALLKIVFYGCPPVGDMHSPSGHTSLSTGLTPVSWSDESLGSGSLALRHVVLRFRGILWFDPRRSYSSVPTRALTRLPRAVAVKDGRLLRPPEGLVLDGREHGGRLMCVAIDGCCMMPVFVVNR